MRNIRNGIKHIMKTVTILATLFAVSFVLAGSASADPNGVLGNTIGLQSAILSPPVASQAFLGPQFGNPFIRPAFNPFFRPPVVNPFFRPPVFNPFFRPVFNPFLNPFIGADVDNVGFGFGFGIGAVD